MKYLLLLLLPLYTFAQTTDYYQSFNEKQLYGKWIKTEFRLKDNSKIFNDYLQNQSVQYHFMPDNLVMATYNGRTKKLKYSLSNNTILITPIQSDDILYRMIAAPAVEYRLKIKDLDDDKLVLLEDNKDSLAMQLRLNFVKSDLYNIGYTPQKFITQGNDTVYSAQQNYIEPLFIDDYRNPMNFIMEKFQFSDWKTAEFTARFIITKDAEVKGIKITGTNDKYNDDLIKAIKKTKNKWQAATWEGKSVNTEIKMRFDYGYTEKQALKNDPTKKLAIDSVAMYKQQSMDYLYEGQMYYENKNYLKALQSYSKSIGLDPYNIDAYYGRVAIYAQANKIDKVCEELEQLKALDQTKAYELAKKYCEKKE